MAERSNRDSLYLVAIGEPCMLSNWKAISEVKRELHELEDKVKAEPYQTDK